MLRFLPPMLVLVVAWALWSGHGEPLIIGFGAMSCLGVFGISRRMDRVVGAEPLDYPLALRSLAYIPWLAIEIVKANLNVASLILNPGTKVHSHLIRVRATQSTELGRVIYANSITLTPGTITLDIRGEDLIIHALSKSAAEGDQEGEMDRRVSRLETQG